MPSEESKIGPITDVMLALAMNHPGPEWLPKELESTYVFARHEHRKQFRKYTREPYIVHPIDVLRRMLDGIEQVSANPLSATVLFQRMLPVLKGCLLHDTVEDCGTSFTTIEKEFGSETAEAVFWVTDTLTKAQGNRETRKRLESARIAAAPLSARCLKLCDIASNTASITEHDKDFAVPYLREKSHLLNLMKNVPEGEDAGVVALFHYLMAKAVANTAVL